MTVLILGYLCYARELRWCNALWDAMLWNTRRWKPRRRTLMSIADQLVGFYKFYCKIQVSKYYYIYWSSLFGRESRLFEVIIRSQLFFLWLWVDRDSRGGYVKTLYSSPTMDYPNTLQNIRLPLKVLLCDFIILFVHWWSTVAHLTSVDSYDLRPSTATGMHTVVLLRRH